MALSILGFAFLAGGVYLSADASTTPTVRTCRPLAVRNIATANPANDQVAYTVTSLGQGKSATASVKAGSDCVGFTISLVSYQTPAANSLPYVKQTIFDSQTKVLAATVSVLTVTVPNCYYQIDLAYGQPLDLATGENYDTDHTMLWGPIGGTKSCTATATPATTSTPVPTSTPGSGGATPTPSVIALGPGETMPPATTQTAISAFLPETGRAGWLMTLLGALLITAGLFHIWFSQRHKLIKPVKQR